jgi:hypothetical protein
VQAIELDAKAVETTEDNVQEARLEWKDGESNHIGKMEYSMPTASRNFYFDWWKNWIFV